MPLPHSRQLMVLDQEGWARGLDYSRLPLEISRGVYASVRSAIIYTHLDDLPSATITSGIDRC